jgi:hypothetical protein
VGATPPTDRQTHEAAVRLAVQCRRIVQACLREEEWLDADREFYLIIRAGLEHERKRERNGDAGTAKGSDQ